VKPPVDLGELTGTEESAPLLGVCSMTVRRWCKSGELPAILIGPTFVLRKADVLAMAAERGKRP
jgi:excisionase family DNA binding protein